MLRGARHRKGWIGFRTSGGLARLLRIHLFPKGVELGLERLELVATHQIEIGGKVVGAAPERRSWLPRPRLGPGSWRPGRAWPFHRETDYGSAWRLLAHFGPQGDSRGLTGGRVMRLIWRSLSRISAPRSSPSPPYTWERSPWGRSRPLVRPRLYRRHPAGLALRGQPGGNARALGRGGAAGDPDRGGRPDSLDHPGRHRRAGASATCCSTCCRSLGRGPNWPPIPWS